MTASTGRNFQELLRTLSALAVIRQHGVATPANWEKRDDVIFCEPGTVRLAAEAHDGGSSAEGSGPPSVSLAVTPYMIVMTDPSVET